MIELQPPGIMRPATLFAAVMLLAMLRPAAASAQAAHAEPASDAGMEYVAYVSEEPARRLVGPDGTVIAEADRFWNFIPAAGGSASDVPPRNASIEAIDLAVLRVLDRQGWELVTCMRDEFAGTYRTVCYLKRPRHEQSHP